MLGFAKKPNDGYYSAEVSIYFKNELVHVISPAARNWTFPKFGSVPW